MDFYNSIEKIDANSFTSEEDRKTALAAARSLCHRLERPMDAMLRIAWIEPSYMACLKIGMDTQVFRALSETGEHKVNDLAKKIGADTMLLSKDRSELSALNGEDELTVTKGRLLRVLASIDTVREVGPDTFAATELSNALLERHVSAAVDYRFLVSNPAFQHLPAFLAKRKYNPPESLLDSPWQYALGTELSFFDWLGQNPEALEMFTSHMSGYTSQRGTWEEIYPIEERLLATKDGTEASAQDIVLVDLGGGAGHDLKRFATKYLTELEGPRLVLQDLPEVIDSVQKSGLLPRSIQAIPIDFCKEPPVAGARAYYMHSVLHDWPDEDVRNILKQIRPILLQETVSGRTPMLLLNENVLPTHSTTPQAAALDLIMMAAFASHERSEEQWHSLLEAAGYKINGIWRSAGVDEAIIEAVADS